MIDLAGQDRSSADDPAAPVLVVRAVDLASTITIAVLWLMALWQCWVFKGLYADGSDVLIELLLRRDFSSGINGARAHAVIVAEAPVVLAIKLGVVDIRWLARALSLGYVALPALLQSAALLRARRDPTVLAVTISAIAIVFMTTSFHVGCESGPAYAAAILTAVWLVTATRLTLGDGIALVLIAALSTRLYEHYAYLGPLLALMTIWSAARFHWGPAPAAWLYALAALLHLVAMVVAIDSLLGYLGADESRRYLGETAMGVMVFLKNRQLMLLLASAGIALLWGIARPRDFLTPIPWLVVGLPLVLVALSPLAMIIGRFAGPPYSWSQQPSRTAAGPMTALIILLLWLRASRFGRRFDLFAVLATPRASRRALALALVMLMAMVPWNSALTVLYARYLDIVKEAVRSQTGVFPVDETIMEIHPRLAHHDFAVASLSVLLRATSHDAILTVPRGLLTAYSFDPTAPPVLAPFRWGD